MGIDWAGLITAVHALIIKARAGEATARDWIDVAFLLIQAIKQISGGPIYRSASHAGELEHDPAFTDINEEKWVKEEMHKLAETLTGDMFPVVRGDGRFIKMVLPLLLKYLLPLLLTSDKEIVTEVLSEVVNKLVS